MQRFHESRDVVKFCGLVLSPASGTRKYATGKAYQLVGAVGLLIERLESADGEMKLGKSIRDLVVECFKYNTATLRDETEHSNQMHQL